MATKKKDIQEAYERWQEAREVSAILRTTWASLIRGERLFLESALNVGIKTTQATQLHSEMVASAKEEYTKAFTYMCELSDEYIALKLAVYPPPKKVK
ncbi:MAG: hypothetical protein ACKN9T_10050 [Candidatus Methylumidiphilus sp.]